MFCIQLHVMSLFLFSSYFFLQDVFLHEDTNNASWKSFFHRLVNLHDNVCCREVFNVLAFLLIYVINLFLKAGAAFWGSLLDS